MRVQFHPFTAGLFVAGDRALTPPGFLRRNVGLGYIRSGTLKSRWGSQALFSYLTPPHSLVRFAGSTFAGVGTDLFRDGTALALPAPLSGDRLTFVKAPRTVGTTDMLYVAGGNELLKVRGDTGAVSQWGQTPPVDGIIARKTINKTKTAFTGAAQTITVSTSVPAQLTGEISYTNAGPPYPDLTKFSGGTPSLLGDYLLLYVLATRPVNLGSITVIVTTNTAAGTGQFIRQLHVVGQVDPATALVATENFIGPDQTDPAPGGIEPTPTIPDINALQRFLTSGFVPGDLNHTAARQRVQVATDRYGQPIYSYSEIPKRVASGTSQLVLTPNVWQPLFIPKNTFTIDTTFKLGTGTNVPGWEGVQKLTVQAHAGPVDGDNDSTNDACDVIISPLPDPMANGPFLLLGGTPILGTVKYRIVEVDDYSGAVSNPNPAYLDVILGSPTAPFTITALSANTITDTGNTIDLDDASLFPVGGGVIQIDDEILTFGGKTGNTLTGLDRAIDLTIATAHAAQSIVTFFREATAPSMNRHQMELTNLPDPSAGHHLRVYRTMGNQEIFFKATDLLAGKTSGYDVGLKRWLDDYADFASLENPPHVLSTEALLFDNVKPEPTYNGAVGPWQGRMWWFRDATNRLYYSPPGRYESVANFIEITHSEDQIQSAVIWQGQLIVFTKFFVIIVSGESEPFSFIAVAGAAGTTEPFSVVATPSGVFYKAQDGLRLFNGLQSDLVGFDTIGPIFRGEAVEGLSALASPIVATFARNELWLSDGVETLIYMADGRWRVFGRGFAALTYDAEQDDLLGALQVERPSAVPNGETWLLEEIALLDDAGFPIPIEWQTASQSPMIDATLLVQRLYIAARCAGQFLTPTLVLDDGTEIALPTFTGPPFVQTYEFSVNRTSKVVGVRITGQLINTGTPIEISRIELDWDD